MIVMPKVQPIAPFERTCERCYGEGCYNGTTTPCLQCGGCGRELTAFGQALSEFLKGRGVELQQPKADG